MIDIDPSLVGIPYLNRGRDAATGLDCWGLLRHFYAKHLQVALPSYADAYEDAADRAETNLAINARVGHGWRLVDTPCFGDAVCLRLAGTPCHVGVYLKNGQFLHTQPGFDSAIDDLRSWRWKNRIAGFYRYDIGRQVF